MKKLVIVAAVIAMFSAASASVMAKKVDRATAYCSKLAKKHHVTKDKMGSYMKTCVEKHQKKYHKKKHKKSAAPAAPATGK